MKSSKQSAQFFWEQNSRKSAKQSKNRFNLLLLEYGEYFLEDLSAYYFPIPTNDLTRAFELNDSLKSQGRLKLSSRSLIFEPSDIRRPILKFPYKFLSSSLERFRLKASEQKQLSVEVSGFFTFLSTSFFELKANNKVGPYKAAEYLPNAHDTMKGFRIVIALVHSDLSQFLTKVEQLRHIFLLSEKQGFGYGKQLLRPHIESALVTQFDSSHLVDFHEQFLLSAPVAVKKVKPLVINPGSLMVTNARVYFQPAQLNNIGDSIQHFELRKVSRVFKRRYMLQQVGLELIMQDGSSAFFALDSRAARDAVHDLVDRNVSKKSHVPLEEVTRKWQKREMSNFDYLMYLNNEADRTSNDLTQYPVFPHVIADFSSPKLRLDDPATFRDLSKPIGALNPERLRYFQQRYDSMQRDDHPPPFLYGTHYSTPGYVLYYLVRVAPEYMLCLQNGKFDAPDRMFHSVAANWESCLNNPADLKELIPEFFHGGGDFLLNMDDLELGFRHTGERLNDVELPPWADTPREFIRKNAKALESDYVSDNLHKWIDLIFGCKQKGEPAVDADNLFYYLTYEGSVDLERITDETERSAIEMQIQEFGQTPKQLFLGPHPRRSDRSAEVSVRTASKKMLTSSAAESSVDQRKNNHNVAPMSAASSVHSTSSAVKADDAVPPSAFDRLLMNCNEDMLHSLLPMEPPVRSATTPTPNVVHDSGQSSAKLLETGCKPSGGSLSAGLLRTEALAAEASDNIGIMRLDADFHREVETELRAQNARVQAKAGPDMQGDVGFGVFSRFGAATSDTSSGSFASSFGVWSEKTASFLDKTFGATFNSNAGLKTPSSSPRANAYVNPPSRLAITLQPSAHYEWHSAAVTGVSVSACAIQDEDKEGLAQQLQATSLLGIRNRRRPVLTATIASVSRDTYLKVTRIDYSPGVGSGSTGAFVATAKRKYSASNAPLTDCCMAPDGIVVLLGSQDNHIYSYLVANHEDDQRLAHEEGVTRIALDRGVRYLLTGSHDKSVKLWNVQSAAEASQTSFSTTSGTSSGIDLLLGSIAGGATSSSSIKVDVTSVLSSRPMAVFSDLEGAVMCVALDDTGTYAAAGADDGSVAVWHIQSESLLFCYSVTMSDNCVTCAKWIPLRASKTFYGHQRGFSEDKLLCASSDGRLLCIDSASRLFSAIILPAGLSVQCLDVDNRGLIYGGCNDGGLRVWLIDSTDGKMNELFHYSAAHTGNINSVAVSMPLSDNETQDKSNFGNDSDCSGVASLVVTGGEDSIIRVWKTSLIK